MRRDEAPPSPYPISCDAARLPFHPPPLPPPPPISSVPRPGFVLCAPPLSPPTSAVPRQGSALRPQARALHHPASGRPAWWDNRKCGRSHNMQGALKLALCITQLQGALRGGTTGSVGVHTICRAPSSSRSASPSFRAPCVVGQEEVWAFAQYSPRSPEGLCPTTFAAPPTHTPVT